MLFCFNVSQNPFRYLFNQLTVCQMRVLKDPPVSIVALYDGPGTGFKRRAESMTCAGEQRTETVDGVKSFTLL